jgi:carbamoyl-phosphate synthase large subunit
MKLLISGLGGSLFPYLHDQIKNKFEIFYVDADEQLERVYATYNFFKSPWVIDTAYWPFVKNIIEKNGIDFYIPLIDEEIIQAKSGVEGFCNVKVISPAVDFAALCINKYELMQRLNEEKISSVVSFTGDIFNWEIEAPVFVKPISGRGSRGIRKIADGEQLDAYYKLERYLPADILIQQYLEGTEYTVGVLVNNLNNVISISSKKVIRKKGITQIAVTEDNAAIDTICMQVVEKLKPCGPINIQLILTPSGEIKIFEINPRFSTTSIMEFAGGVDLISSYVANYNKPYTGEVVRPEKNLLLYRRWENIFLKGE